MDNSQLLELGPPNFTTEMAPQILNAWKSFSAKKNIPSRKEVDPLKIPAKLLPYIWIYKFDPDKNSYQRVFAGEEITNAWKKTTQNPYIEEFMDEASVTLVREHWNYLRENLALSHYIQTAESDFRYTERLSLPLADENGNLNYIFGCTYYERMPYPTKESAPPSNPEHLRIFSLSSI